MSECVRLEPELPAQVMYSARVGKTTFCEALAAASSLEHLEVSKMVREKRFCKTSFQIVSCILWGLISRVQAFVEDCSIFDEEMVQDALEPLLDRVRLRSLGRSQQKSWYLAQESGGCVVDFHSSSFLDESLVDLVVVLRVDTSTLYDRLEKRHYPESKVKQNVEER
eukprot:g29584.t1